LPYNKRRLREVIAGWVGYSLTKIVNLNSLRINRLKISSDKSAGRNKNKNIISNGKIQNFHIIRELKRVSNLVSKIIKAPRDNETLFLLRIIVCNIAPAINVIEPKYRIRINNSASGVGSCCII
jgi:hypothetical protein